MTRIPTHGDRHDPGGNQVTTVLHVGNLHSASEKAVAESVLGRLPGGGAMCVGGAVLAAIGLRRSTHDHRAGEPIPPAPSGPVAVVTASVRHRLCEPAAPR